MSEYYTVEQCWHKDNGVVTLDNDIARKLVAISLGKVPKKVADRVYDKCIFILPAPWAGTVPKYLSDKKQIIYISEKLLKKKEEFIIKIILHEVAHFYLKHRCPLLGNLTEEENSKQEHDADDQATQWLSTFNKLRRSVQEAVTFKGI